MSEINQLDPEKVIVSFRGITVRGYAAGTFVTAEHTEDAVKMTAGAGGDVARVINRVATGSITVTLMQGVEANQLLSLVALEDRMFGTGYGPIEVADLAGTSLYTGKCAWIRKLPAGEHADDNTARAWVFDVANLVMNVGSNSLPVASA